MNFSYKIKTDAFGGKIYAKLAKFYPVLLMEGTNMNAFYDPNVYKTPFY